MPSLRRTASSPSVRSSPYLYSSSSNGAVATRGHGHRRSSGSETTSRRVLADIEWWRVTDGQRDTNADHEFEDRTPDDQDPVADNILGAATLLSPDAGVEHLPVALPWIPTPAVGSSETLRDGFAALSIAPRTPTHQHRRQASDSSASSLESTPEAPETTLNGVCQDVSDVDASLLEATLPPLHTTGRGSRFETLPSLLVRSHTFADCLSLHDAHPGHYADFAVSPLSSSPSFLN